MDKTSAILIRRTKLTETSLILTWITESHGRVKTVAKGARAAKSRFAGVLDLFFLCEVGFARSRRGELHSLREVQLVETHAALRFDYPRLALAAYFAELVELVTELDHPDPELYLLMKRALGHLGEKPASVRALEFFESEVVRHLGIQEPGLTAVAALARTYHRIPASRQALPPLPVR